MLRPPPFPRSIGDLDCEFLSECLGRRVADFTATRIGADRGMLGEIFLLRVDDGSGAADGPTEFVAKFAALREESLASARRGGSHERELRCFDELLTQTDVRVPRCHGAFYDPTDATFLLLQEAIATDATVDQIVGLTSSQARLVLTEAARLHARWWDDASLRSADWLPAIDASQRIHNLTTLASRGWPRLVEVLGDELTDAERRLGVDLPARIASALAELGDLPTTLLHCDLRADNLLFAPEGDRVTLIDWQGAGLGPPAFDLAYLLTQSLAVDDRRRHEAALLDFYRDELARAGVDLSVGQICDGYSASLHYGLAVACAIPLVGDPAEPRVKRLAASVARRSIEALRDHEQLWEHAT